MGMGMRVAGAGGGPLSVQWTQGADLACHPTGAVPSPYHTDRARGRVRDCVSSPTTIFLHPYSSMVGGSVGGCGVGGGSLSVQWTKGADRAHHGMAVVPSPVDGH